MPSQIDTFALKRAKDGILRALRTIDRADGYNTSPKAQIGAVQMDKVPAGELPFLAVEFGDMALDAQLFGGASFGILRIGWPAFVWGYVGSSGNADDLYEAGLALLADVLAAIYAAETLPDGAGQDTVIAVEPGTITFDMEQFAAENRGYFLAEFTLIVDLIRGANP